MSSAPNHKRDPLEEEFQRRMHDAEATPSPDLWARIDHELTVQENRHYKDRMVLYRQLAAACFVMFVLAGALLTFNFSKNDKADTTLATVEKATPTRAAIHAGVEQIAAESISRAAATNRTDVESGVAPEVEPTASATLHQSIASAKDDVAATRRFIGRSRMQQAQHEGARLVVKGNAEAVEDAAVNLNNSKEVETSTVFKSLEPFYRTARQTIASVPPAFKNSAMGNSGAAQQAVKAPSVLEIMPKAVKELSGTGKTESEQKQNTALAMNKETKDTNQSSNQSDDSRWSLGLAYAPSYFNQNIGMPTSGMGMAAASSGRYSLTAPQGPSASMETARNMDEARDEFEKNTDPAFSFGVEFKTGLKLTKKLIALAGIGYTQNSSRTKSSFILEQFAIKPSTNERVPLGRSTLFVPSLENNFSTDSINVAKTDDFEVRYRYRHLTVPVGLQYQGKISKEWYWYAAGGVAANFLLETTIMASTNDVRNVSYDFEDESPFRKVQFSGNVSAGVGKHVSNSVSVMVGPEYRGFFNSLLAESDKVLAPQGRPYTFGLNMAVIYNLGSAKK